MSVNACLCPAVSVHGCAVTTVEGIGSTRTRPHPVQACVAEHHGSQCGFCTPGIVMSAYTMLRSLPGTVDEKDLQVALQGRRSLAVLCCPRAFSFDQSFEFNSISIFRPLPTRKNQRAKSSQTNNHLRSRTTVFHHTCGYINPFLIAGKNAR